MKNETHPNKKNMTDTNEMRLSTMRRVLADRPMLDSLRPEDLTPPRTLHRRDGLMIRTPIVDTVTDYENLEDAP